MQELDLGGARAPQVRRHVERDVRPASTLVLINSDYCCCPTQCPARGECVLDVSDCCQHPLKAHKNKLSIGLPVGKIDSVRPSVASISSDRGAYHAAVIGSNSWTGI